MAQRDRRGGTPLLQAGFVVWIAALALAGCGEGGARAGAPDAGGGGGAGAPMGRGGTGGVDPLGGGAGGMAGGRPVPPPGGATGCGVAWSGDLQIGTAQDDQITAVRALDGGGFLVTGYEAGDDHSSDVIPTGNARAIVARYDASGSLVWETAIDTPQADTAEDVRVDAAGNLVVVGRTAGSFTGFQNAGQMDMFVMALDGNGGFLGSVQVGDERPQHPARLALAGHSIWVVGYDDVFIPSNFVAALPHGFLAQFTAGAAPGLGPTENFWHRSALFDSPPPPPSNQDFWTGVAVDGAADGAIYVSSTVDGAVDLRGMFITKLDASGQTVWSKRLSSNAGDYVSALGLNQNGDLIAAGAATLEVAGTEVGQQDAFVAKIDKATGAVQWVTATGSSESDFPTDLTFDRQGNIYIAGQTLGTVAGASPNQGGVDLFAAEIGPSGGVLASWQRGSPGDDFATGLAVDACGAVLVGGYTTGSLVAGQANAGGDDAFVVRLAPAARQP